LRMLAGSGCGASQWFATGATQGQGSVALTQLEALTDSLSTKCKPEPFLCHGLLAQLAWHQGRLQT